MAWPQHGGEKSTGITILFLLQLTPDGGNTERGLACYVCALVACGQIPQPCSPVWTASSLHSTKSAMRHFRFAFHIIFVMYIWHSTWWLSILGLFGYIFCFVRTWFLKTGGLNFPLRIMRTGPACRRDVSSYQLHYVLTITIIIIVWSIIIAKVE